MKTGILLDIERASFQDGPGVRTVIFFKGCSLRCMWCHNPESYQFGIQTYMSQGVEKTYGYTMDIESIKKEILKDKDYFDASGGGITLSGGEALLQLEICQEILKFCHEKNIHCCIETSGFVPLTSIQSVIEYVDCWLYDYKLSEDNKYKDYIQGEAQLILDNLHYLIRHKKQDIILRCPMIKGINDTQLHFDRIAALSQSVTSVEILPYHHMGKQKAIHIGIEDYFYQDNTDEATKKEWLKEIRKRHCYNVFMK